MGKGSESFYTGSFPKKGGDAAALNVMTQAVIDWFHQKFIATEKVEDSSQGEVQETTDKNEMVPAETASDVSKLQVNEIIQKIRSSRQKEKFENI